MAYTLTDYIRGFHKLNRAKCFSSSVQSTFLAIACEFDAQGFPDEIELSTRELQLRSGLKSVSTVHEAKNVLKMNRLIDFRTRKKQRTTFFFLCSGHLSECSVGRSIERSTEHLPEQGSEQSTEHLTEQQGLVCCTQNAGATTNTRDDGDENAATPLPPSPAPLSSIPPTTLAINPINQSPAIISKAGRAEDEKDELKIEDVWRQMTGKRLEKAQDCDELHALEKTHGREIIKVAIAEHVRCKGRSFNYFKACLQSALEKKGGERNGRTFAEANRQGNTRKLERPDYSSYPFAKGES